ncbi:lipoprotein [Achromatium sp. WMS3]|nr:lipoprotein [Achromatium sp. WMS3]
MLQINIQDVKTQLSQLIEQAERGEEIIILRADTPIVRLTAITPKFHGRRFGALKGRAQVDEKFFEPLPEKELAAWE